MQEAFQFALAHPERTVQIQFRHQNKNGEWRHLELVGQNRLPDPEIGGIVADCRDVTDRWRVEEELRNSEKQYRLLFHGNPNPMWVFRSRNPGVSGSQRGGHSTLRLFARRISDHDPCGHSSAGKKPTPPQTVALDTPDRNVIWRQRRKDGSFIDVEVVWSPMVFGERFAALTMASDVTERLRVEHRNSVFSKLGHRLSSASTNPEAARIICEAADALFKWDDFALDLYFADRDEVFSLLTITTVEGRRVEIPPSPQPKTANALVQRVIKKGAELLSSFETRNFSAVTMLAPIRKGEHVIGVLFDSKPHARHLFQPRFGNAPDPGRPVRRRAWNASAPSRICAKAGSVFAICLRIRPTPFLLRTWTARCWTSILPPACCTA